MTSCPETPYPPLPYIRAAMRLAQRLRRKGKQPEVTDQCRACGRYHVVLKVK